MEFIIFLGYLSITQKIIMKSLQMFLKQWKESYFTHHDTRNGIKLAVWFGVNS